MCIRWVGEYKSMQWPFSHERNANWRGLVITAASKTYKNLYPDKANCSWTIYEK